jgi:DNA-binding XRE family transcriptional regulator
VVKEMEQFQNDLLASVRQMKSGKAARITNVNVSSIVAARNTLGLSQSRFAELLGVSKRTLQEREGYCIWLKFNPGTVRREGRREPSLPLSGQLMLVIALR